MIEPAGPSVMPPGLLPHVSDIAHTDDQQPTSRHGDAVPAARGSQAAARVVRAALMAGTVAAPLVFAPWSDETFARPKLMALVIVTVLGLLASAGLAHRWQPAAADLPLAALAVILVAATVASPDPATSLAGRFPEYQGLLASGTYVGVFVLARLGLTPATAGGWLRTAAVAGTVVAGYALVQASGWDPLWGDQAAGRTFGTIGLPNSLAAVLVVSAPLSAAVALVSTRAPVWWTLAAIQAAALVTTQSRGGYLGLVVAGAVMATLARRASPAAAPRLRTMAPIAAAAAALVLVPGVRTQLGDGGDRIAAAFSGNNQSVQQHLALWDVASTAAAQQPLLGAGPDLFPETYLVTAPQALDPSRQALFAEVRPESPHNVPLALASGSGVPSMVAYLAFVGAVLVAGLRSIRDLTGNRRNVLAGLLAAAAGHVVTDMFMTAEVTSSWLFWLVLGAIVVQSTPSRRRAT